MSKTVNFSQLGKNWFSGGKPASSSAAAQGAASPAHRATLRAHNSKLEEFLRKHPAKTCSADIFARNRKDFAAVLAPNALFVNNDAALEWDVALTRTKLALWLTETKWPQANDACQKELKASFKDVCEAALRLVDRSFNSAQLKNIELKEFEQLSMVKAEVSAEKKKKAESVIEAARTLAGRAKQLRPLLRDYQLHQQCESAHDHASWMIRSLKTTMPSCVSEATTRDISYAPSTIDWLVALKDTLPQGPKSLPLDVARASKMDAQKALGLGHPPSRQDGAAQRRAGAKVKTIQLGSQKQYELVALPKERAGCYGKIYRATELGGEPRQLIVKQQRTLRKRRPGVGQEARSLTELMERTSRAVEASGRIDDAIVSQPGLFAPEAGALRGLTAEAEGARLLNHFTDSVGKYYQVMVAMDGDLGNDLHGVLYASVAKEGGDGKDVPGAQQAGDLQRRQTRARHARLSAATQSFLQLAAMHQEKSKGDLGIAHLDLKPNNILFSKTGQVRLIDFDEAKTVNKSPARGPFKAAGSIASPEKQLEHLRKIVPQLGKAYDIWCLGTAFLDVGFDKQMNPPWDVTRSSLKSDANFALYEAWHGLVVANGAEPSLANAELPDAMVRKIIASAEKKYAPVGTADAVQLRDAVTTIHKYFHNRYEADADLTVLLLQRALVPEPKERASAEQIKAELLKKMATLDDEARAHVVDLFRAAADHNDPVPMAGATKPH